jgi:hypothetical protein
MLLALAAVLAAAAPAFSRPIYDQAELFSPEAVRQADDEAREISRDFRVAVLVDTFSTVPTLRRLRAHLNEPQAREHFFTDWARSKAKRAGVSGIYVFICKEPAPVEVRVIAGRHLLDHAFTEADCEQLRHRLQDLLQQGRADEGLHEALRFVQAALHTRVGILPEVRDPFPWLNILWVIAILLGFWGFAEFLRSLAEGRQGRGEAVLGAVGYGGAGSIPAGLFAVMTSSWLGHLLRRHGVTSPAVPDLGATAEPDAGPPFIGAGSGEHGPPDYAHDEP